MNKIKVQILLQFALLMHSIQVFSFALKHATDFPHAMTQLRKNQNLSISRNFLCNPVILTYYYKQQRTVPCP